LRSRLCVGIRSLRADVSTFAALLVLLAFTATAQPYTRTVKDGGTVVTVNLDRLGAQKSGPLQELEDVTVRVKVTDAASGASIPGGSPAAWLDRKPDGATTTAEQCAGKIKRFAEGSTFSRTELDLTSFYVVLMNQDATLTVVDPRFGYGDTRLLAMVALDAPAEDWALTADGKLLFVSQPSANEVALVDTATWQVKAKADRIARAARVALQPDEAYVWVANESGMAVLRAGDLKPVAHIATGKGYHHIAFSGDSSFAFVTNPESGTVSVIDVRKLVKLRDIEVGAQPTWIAYSDLAKAVYVANEGDGKVTVIDTASHNVVATVETAPGLGQIRVAPGGRYALAVNPVNDYIYVIDAASNRIVQQGKLDKGPDRIAFTNKQAHIRHRGSDAVLMISLDTLGAGGEISAADFPAGRHAPGDMTLATPADGIVQASGENGVLVANPKDKSVYFYMEGMAAPMGNFSNYGREPRAVLSVDRNLRERAPGVYETTAKLPAPGSYDLALLLDQPRVVACFDVTIAPDPASTVVRPPKMKVEPSFAAAVVGEPARISFRLTRAETKQPDNGAQDMVVLVAGPAWQRRAVASSRGDGVYSVEFVVPEPGVYNVLMTAPSRGLEYATYGSMRVGARPN
jgi:YVTN family beta-propeller protein